MAVVENPRSALPAKLRGLHLFHYGAAPCPQRVRFLLAEKGIRRAADVRWDSEARETLEAPAGSYIARAVSLPRQQNLTPGYAAVHPHMVVPALVHDGVVHIESVEIMNYIHDELPGPSLVPDGVAGETCRRLIAEAAALQPSVRHVTYRWSLGGIAKLKPEKQAQVRALDAPDSPEQLGRFYTDFSNDEIPERVFAGHVLKLEAGFGRVDALLASDGRTWVTGERFSMADILWSVKTLRLFEAGYPFGERFPTLSAWFDRVRARPGFREAIWRDVRVMSRVFRLRGTIQNYFGRGLRAALATP